MPLSDDVNLNIEVIQHEQAVYRRLRYGALSVHMLPNLGTTINRLVFNSRPVRSQSLTHKILGRIWHLHPVN
ncbi:hypothetical protein ACJ72_02366 [Emergomyces africanus]|uniref:Uncharacterized protein n=1 Tax=Emergomyces africanus TaxID=1955775 RepID=A0A1B7P2N2_9EURO|nr:hypothetical protein ACJ72_02366 [Emergomyces africanus]